MSTPTIPSNKWKVILVIAVLLITVVLLWSKCNQQTTNTLIADIKTSPQKTETIRLNDSLKLVAQEVLIAENQKQIHYLESTLQAELFRKIKIGKATTSIEFKDSIVYVNIPGKPAENDYQTGSEVKFPLHFKHDSKYLRQSYTVLSADSSQIDSLGISNKEHIVIGESGKWYQKKTIKVGILNENPYYIVDSLRSMVYKPKEKLQLTVGPMIMGNKNSFSGGVGVTIKKGIFSVTVGYKVF